MATIIENGRWVVPEAVGDDMVERGLLFKCDFGHGKLDYEGPIYHKAINAPDWFDVSTMPMAIKDSVAALEYKNKSIRKNYMHYNENTLNRKEKKMENTNHDNPSTSSTTKNVAAAAVTLLVGAVVLSGVKKLVSRIANRNSQTTTEV